MKYFDKDFTSFFSELEKNNNKDWFDTNRSRYENSVREPFKKFTADLIEEAKRFYPTLNMSPKEAIFRINRDIRFSKDKTPYKIHSSAAISPYGKKAFSKPALYVQANHNDIRVYSGCYQLSKEELMDVRYHIAENLSKFQSLINDPDFVSTFGEVLGEKNKRIPPQFNDIQDVEPLIFNKNFYYYFKLPPETIYSENLIESLLSRFEKGLPLSAFLIEAQGG